MLTVVRWFWVLVGTSHKNSYCVPSGTILKPRLRIQTSMEVEEKIKPYAENAGLGFLN